MTGRQSAAFTRLELCGLPPPGRLEGRSLVSLLKNPIASWDHPARSVVYHNDVVGKTIVDERWRYTEWDGGKQGRELYDHDADPGEYQNLADDPRFAGSIAEMKRMLAP